MTKIWQLTSTKSMGGVSNRLEFNNTYNFALDAGIDSPALKRNMLDIAEMEQALFPKEILIKDVTCKELPQGGNHVPDPSFVSKTYNFRGTRTSNGDLMPLEICVGIERIADHGKNGLALFRGVLGEGDVDATSDNSYELKPPAAGNAATAIAAFITDLEGGLTNGIWVFPHSPKKPTSPDRLIVDHVLKGVLFKQVHNLPTSWQEDAESAAKKLKSAQEATLRRLRSGSTTGAISPDTIKEVARAALQIKTLLQLIPATRASAFVFGALWKDIPIPDLAPLGGL